MTTRAIALKLDYRSRRYWGHPLVQLCAWSLAVLLASFAGANGVARGQSAVQPIQFDLSRSSPPMLAVLPQEPESVYAPPAPPTESEGVNNGGVKTSIYFAYLTDYVFRGVSHNFATGVNRHSANYQGEARLEVDLGKLPHPFAGVFANINDSDPVSRFQEIRPFFGLEYTIRPLTLEAGVQSYLYPERERLNPSPNTSEAYVKITVDDSYWWLTAHPILQPYILAVYDYQRNKGSYFEAGVRHDFLLEDLGFTVTLLADVAYVNNYARIFVASSKQDCGFQHYDLGVIGSESLNTLFDFSPRFGQISLQGYLTYTSRIERHVFADTTLWGGVGLAFKY